MRTRLMIALLAAITMITATVGLTAGVASAELVDPNYPSSSSGINGPGTKGITEGALLPAPGGENAAEIIQIGGAVLFRADYGANAASLQLKMGDVVLATQALNGSTEVVAEFGTQACGLVGSVQSVTATVTDAAGAVLYVDVLNFSPAQVGDPTGACGAVPPPPPPPPPPPVPAPAPAPAAPVAAVVAGGVESTGHIVVADHGYSALVNGYTLGDTAKQATDITPKQGQASHAAPAAKELAYTGDESFYLVYAGLGLVAAGAVAMGSRRRLHTVTED